MTKDEKKEFAQFVHEKLGMDSDTFLRLRLRGEIPPLYEPSASISGTATRGRPAKYMWKGAKLRHQVARPIYDRIVKRLRAEGTGDYNNVVQEEISRGVVGRVSKETL